MFGIASEAALSALEKLSSDTSERLRLLRFADRWRIYADDYKDLVETAVRAIFSDEEKAKRICAESDSTINPLKQVIDETWAYPGADRRFVNEGGDPDPVYEAVKEAADFDTVMAEVFTAAGGFNDCIIQVLPGLEDEQGWQVGLPTVQVFFPHECSVISDPRDRSQIKELRYITERDDGQEVIVCWTRDEHWVEIGGRRTWADGRSDTVDPFGRLPFVPVHRGLRAACFWDASTGQDLVEFTLQYARDWAVLNFTQHQQSFNQIHVKGVDENWGGFKTMGPGTLFRTGDDVEVNVLDLHAELQPTIEKLKTQLTMFLQSHSVNAERYMQNPGQAPMSGVAREIERKDLIDKRRRSFPMMLRAEREFAALYRWAYNWHRKEPISEDAKFDVAIRDEEILQSPKEKAETRKVELEVLEKERALGLRTPAEQLAADLGISIEDAEARLKAVPPKPQIFAYHIESGMVSRDQVLVSLGFDPIGGEEGKLTLPELRAKYPERYGAAPSSSAAQE